MLFLVIEEFRNGDPKPVYERFSLHGRLAPEGVRYIDSWVTTDLTRCYQVMECEHVEELGAWMVNWSDIVDFTVVPVVSSSEGARQVADFGSPSPVS